MSAWKGWIIPGVEAGFRTKKAALRHIWETNMVGVEPIRVRTAADQMPKKKNPTSPGGRAYYQWDVYDKKSGRHVGVVIAKNSPYALKVAKSRGWGSGLKVLRGEAEPGFGLDRDYRKPFRKNPTKAQKRARASKQRKNTGLIKAVRSLLKKTNPSARITGASVVKLKGGTLKITPIKANAGAGGKYKVLFYGKTGYEQPVIRYYKTWSAARSAAKKHRAKHLVAYAEAV